MEATLSNEGNGMPCGVPGDGRLWLLPVLALVGWQCWMTLTLFGSDNAWSRLTNDQPIISGKHPLHLYHGHLGARAFLRTGSASCYDPSFQAGYPKTPVFDGGCRPAELSLLLCNGEFRPDVYKIGLALSCLLVPFVMSVASRGAGLSRRAVFLSVLLGCFVWWGRPCQQAIQDGDLDLLLASLAALALSGLLLRYDRKPGGRAYLGTLLAGFLGWLFQPLLLAILLPVFLIYYLSVGVRHRLVWSVMLLAGLFLAIGANFFWLREWIGYWWLRVPLSVNEFLLPHRTLPSLWRAPIWGESVDRAFAGGLILFGIAGVILLNQNGKRPAARLFGLASLLLIVLAVGSILNEMLGKFSASGLLVPGLLFAVPLAAHALEMCWRGLLLVTARPWVAGTIVTAALGGLLLLPDALPTLHQRSTAASPLQIGLKEEQRQIIATIEKHTTTEARILWENMPREQCDSGWTALLPLLTGRSYIGGLDSTACIEHTLDGLCRQMLAGRPLNEWTETELADYCRRYNIGWVVCWSAPAQQRFRSWSQVRLIGDIGKGQLFAIDRQLSFILKGKARWLGADAGRICLADVVPENGVVVLSLHFQRGLIAAPARVKVEPEEAGIASQDVLFVRLTVTSPVAHLTLIWQK